MKISGQLHAPMETAPQYPLHRKQNGPQSWSECSGEEKNLLPLQGIEPQFLSIPAFNVKENAQI
jgi:hypothetical protein